MKAVRSEGRILLCEGYKDVLAFHACGIRYAVGLCGTALTEEHIRAIRRLAGQVTLSLDPIRRDAEHGPVRPYAPVRGMRPSACFPCPTAWTGPRCTAGKGATSWHA